jgi:hypothetical protein
MRKQDKRKGKNALKGVRKKGKTEVVVGSGLSILIKMTMKVLYKERTRMNRDKSRRVETENGGLRRDRSRREKSPYEGSRRDRREGGKSLEGEISHQSRSHRDKSCHNESRCSRNETKMKDLEKKYDRILRQIDGEDPELTA